MNLRLAGVEDGSFQPSSRETVLCCVCTEGASIQWVKMRRVAVDGVDATRKLLEMLADEPLDAVILGGISYAGFNIVDAADVYRATGKPVVVYIGEELCTEAMLAALRKHFPDWEERWRLVEQLGNVYTAVIRGGLPPVFYEVYGATPDEGEKILREAAVFTRTPEPVRVAGLVARGVT